MGGVWYAFVCSGLLLLTVGFGYACIHAWLRPEADLGVLLGGLGLAMVILSVVVRGMKRPEVERRSVYVPLKKCPKCGKSYVDIQNCPTCGVKLEPTRDRPMPYKTAEYVGRGRGR